MAQPQRALNQNVALVFCLRIADGIANGIWNLSVLSTYISVLEGSTKAGNTVRYPAASCRHQWLARSHPLQRPRLVHALHACLSALHARPPRLLTPPPALRPRALQRVGFVQAIQGTALAASALPGEPLPGP